MLFSDVDTVCQIEPYTRAKHECLLGAWSHKLLPIPFIFKHESALCYGAHFKPYWFQTSKSQSLFSLAVGIHLFIGQVIKRAYMQTVIRRVLFMWLLEFGQCCLDRCQGLLLSDMGEVSIICEKVLHQFILSPERLTSNSPCPDPLSVQAWWRSSRCHPSVSMWRNTKTLECGAQWWLPWVCDHPCPGNDLCVGSVSGALVHVWRKPLLNADLCFA